MPQHLLCIGTFCCQTNRPVFDSLRQPAASKTAEAAFDTEHWCYVMAHEPFYGDIYYPPKPRYGTPSFTQVLYGIVDAWQDRREELLTAW